MHQIQLKFILPLSSFSETLEYTSLLSLKELKNIIWEYFQLQQNSQFLRIRTEKYDIRICEDFPLDFYSIEPNYQIIIEDIHNFKERMTFFQRKKRITQKKMQMGDGFETSKHRQFLANNLNKLIEESAKGDLACIKSLIESNLPVLEENDEYWGYFVNKKNTIYNEIGCKGWNAIHAAIVKEQKEILSFFIKKKANFNIATVGGWTPLMLTINLNNMELFKMLIPFVDINLKTSKGTALHIAIKKKAKGMISILLDNHADCNIKDKDDKNAFEICKDSDIHLLLEQPSPNETMRDPTQIPFISGELYKIRNLLISGGNQRFFIIDPTEGTFTRYIKREDYPFTPKEIVYLKDIRSVRRIQPTWYMRKDLLYFEIEYFHSRQTIGCKHLSTLKLWMYHLEKAILLFKDRKLSTQKFDMKAYQKLEKVEILDVEKVQDEMIYSVSKSKELSNNSPTNKARNSAIQQPEANNKEAGPRKNKFAAKGKEENTSRSLVTCKSQTNIRQNYETLETSLTSPLGSGKSHKARYDSFEILRLLGSGTFGKVFLARKKDNGKLYAMKVLKKKDLIFKKHLKYAVTESNILKKCDHPFILRIHFSFQTPKNFYLVIDYCRGDLAHELSKCLVFKEDVARFYIAQLVLAIEYLHQQNVIYRDLKPENILLDLEGNSKLADFGLSKEGIGDDDKTRSFCGSPAYLSPEVVINKNKGSAGGYGKSTDVYGIGAVMYELLVGSPPFLAEEIPEMFKKITEGELTFPKHLSNDAKDLIKKLLMKDPLKRIGVKDKNEIKKHSFFKGIDWGKVYRKEYRPPIARLEVTGKMLKKDDKLKFQDYDYEENNFNENRVPDFSFAVNSFKEKMI